MFDEVSYGGLLFFWLTVYSNIYWPQIVQTQAYN